MKIAFFNSIAGVAEDKGLSDAYIEESFWSTNWQMQIKKSKSIMSEQKKSDERHPERYRRHPPARPVFNRNLQRRAGRCQRQTQKNTGKIGRLGRRPEDRIRPVRTKRTIHQVRLPKAPRSNRQRQKRHTHPLQRQGLP